MLERKERKEQKKLMCVNYTTLCPSLDLIWLTNNSLRILRVESDFKGSVYQQTSDRVIVTVR